MYNSMTAKQQEIAGWRFSRPVLQSVDIRLPTRHDNRRPTPGGE